VTRDQLEHAIRAACDVAEDSEVWVFGSQAILGEFPDAPEALRASIEVDKLAEYRGGVTKPPSSVDTKHHRKIVTEWSTYVNNQKFFFNEVWKQ
jgi:hypothetical protein